MRNWACLPLKVAIIYSWRFQGFSNRAEKRAIVCKWTDIFTCNGRRNITYATLGAGLSDYAFQSKSNLYSPSPPFVSVCPGASTFIIDCSSYILYFSLPSAYVWWLKQLDICQTRYWTHNWNRNVLLLKKFRLSSPAVCGLYTSIMLQCDLQVSSWAISQDMKLLSFHKESQGFR